MNIELPDGTVVEGIPEGISKQELGAKLKANGMTVPDEWLGPKKVGFIDSALRTAASSAQRAVRTFDLAAASMAGIFGQTEDQDKIFREMEGRQERMNETYAPKADEEFSTPGTLAGGVLSVPNTIVSGPVSAGVDRSAEVLKRGGTGTEAAKAGAASATIEAAMLAVPAGAGVRVAQKMGAAGKGAARSVTAGAVGGAALNVPVGVAGRAADAAALPDRPEFQDMKQDPLDPKAMAMDAVMSGGIAALAAKGAHTSGSKKAQARAAETKAAEWPADKMETLGGDEYRAPNGATVTKEAWENSSQKIRDGWLKPKPVEEKAPAAETKELTLEEANKLQRPEDLVDTRAEDKLLAENPAGEVAQVVSEVRAKKLKDATAAAEQTKNRETAAELRRVAGTTEDVDLKAALLKRADKIDPPAKIPAGEVKEGQPDIPVKTEKVPAGKVVEGQPEIPVETPKAGEIPTGKVEAEYPEGGTPVVREPAAEPVPAGEVKELYADPNREGGPIPKGEATEVEQLPVGEVKEGQPDIPVVKEKIPAGEAIEGEPIPVGEATEVPRPGSIPTGEAKEVTASGATPVEKTEPVPAGQTKELFVDRSRPEALDLGLPQIDEAFMAEQARPRARGAEQRATVAMDERGRRHARAALEKAAAEGKLNKDGVALATWALDKNPNLGADLKVAVLDDPSRPNARGAYNSAQRVVKLFQGRDSPLTAAHEILHHSERMMPQKVQDGIRREWRRHLAAEMKKATPEQRQVLADIPRVISGDAAARARVMKAFEGGVLNRNKHYQLYDPSEFWAENASRILSERHGGRGSWTAEAKQWLREMIEHVKGTIGLRSDAAVLKALNDILDAQATPGRRRSEGMLAHTDVSDMLDLGPSKTKLPDETRIDVVERKLFDRFNRVAKLQQVQPPKRESADIYQADQLYHGRLQARGDKLEREVVRPLGKALEAAKKLDVSVRDADDYLMALHAPERNAVIAARNPKMQDGGSGITDQQAKDIIDSFSPEQRKVLDGIAKMVHDLNRKKLDGMVDDGLITAAQRDNLNQQFKNYVPLKTLDGEETFLGTGQGYSMRANDITSALGRQSKASSPIAASVMDASRAMVRGEKARVDRTIWEYADRDAQDFIRPYDPENPPPEVMDRKIGPDGKVKDIVSSKKVQDMTIDLVVNGEDRKVFIPDDLLREQIKKVATTADPGEALRILGKGTSTIGRLLTEFNPSFTVPNAVKDAITVAMRAGAHKGVSATKVMANIPGAWKTIVEHKVGAKTKGADEYEEFLKHGGKTGAYGIQTAADTMAKLEKLGAELGYDEHAAGYTRKVGRFLAHIPRAISSANEVLEYASRFSLYKEVRAAGGTPGQAAKAAKEITVNFNRSGEWGRAMNAWSVFANAALQGLRNTGVYMKSPVVRRNVMAMTVLGGLVQYWNEQVGGENEETAEPNINSQNDAVADKNLVMLKPGSREGYKIPLPPEYAAFFTIGRRVYRAMSQGDIAREAQGIAGAVLDATLPVRMPESDSHVGSAVRAVFPTVGAPLMDLKVNENFFGQPIVPEQRGRTDVPYFTQSRQNTSELTKSISEIANSVTGGDSVKPGYSQKVLGPTISPEGLEHLAKGYTGGIGQTVTQAGNLLKAGKEGKPVDVNKVPVVSRFAFQEPQSYTSRRYKELATDFEQAKGYRKRGESGKIAPRVQATLEQYEVAEKELTALFKELREAGATGTDREPIQQRIKATQSRVIRAYNQSHEQ